MSLNWNLEKVKNLDKLYIPGKDLDMGGWAPVKPGTEKEGDTYLNPVTNGLIWVCMSVEMGSITSANAEEFFLRLSIWERVVAPMLVFSKGETRLFTLADVKRHIGLSVNVTTLKREAFLKKVGEALVRHAQDQKTEGPSLLDWYKSMLAERFAGEGEEKA